MKRAEIALPPPRKRSLAASDDALDGAEPFFFALAGYHRLLAAPSPLLPTAPSQLDDAHSSPPPPLGPCLHAPPRLEVERRPIHTMATATQRAEDVDAKAAGMSEVTISQKMLSAVSGSVLTSLLGMCHIIY